MVVLLSCRSDFFKSQQAQNVYSMLVQRRSNVVDGGTTKTTLLQRLVPAGIFLARCPSCEKVGHHDQ